jgi:hypothetical protein
LKELTSSPQGNMPCFRLIFSKRVFHALDAFSFFETADLWATVRSILFSVCSVVWPAIRDNSPMDSAKSWQSSTARLRLQGKGYFALTRRLQENDL